MTSKHKCCNSTSKHNCCESTSKHNCCESTIETVSCETTTTTTPTAINSCGPRVHVDIPVMMVVMEEME